MRRFLPVFVFSIVLLVGVGITWTVYDAIRKTAEAQFQSFADEAAARIVTRVNQHLSLLAAAHSFFLASGGEVGLTEFRTFVANLDIKNEFNGIQGIGYAELIRTGNEDRPEARLRAEYGLQRDIWPATTQHYRTPIVLLEPRDPRNDTALGYDMFSEARRRVAMQLAMSTRLTKASAPVELVQEITSEKQAGFLVYKPLYTGAGDEAGPSLPAGFVYAPFRAGDLHTAAILKPPALPLVLETHDITGNDPEILYRSPGFEELRAPEGMTAQIDIDVAGRKWRISANSTGNVRDYADFLPAYALGTVLAILALSLAAGARLQHKAVESAIALHEESRKGLEEKDLLLQEMRHRIKNSIARMSAIARQTASASGTLAEFKESFVARMNAMAKAQDLLARSRWGRADLEDLVSQEIAQVLGMESERARVEGPKVELNERATQALGLVFHELATNALKYSGVADGGTRLDVSWRLDGGKDTDVLQIRWVETGNPVGELSGQNGFGSRLVQASICGELGGEIDRKSDGDGLTITFAIPARSIR